MCGICGFSGNGTIEDLWPMMDAMRYRGPDDVGRWHNGEDLYLGHLRLSIVDLNDGHQPMLLPDGSLAVVFNGEIYNHNTLRRELEKRGHVFQSHHSDTEVLLHGYREWGRKVIDKLNGMWAFALFDRRNNLLWLSRDRFGKKPLYYSQIRETLIFSSELSSLSVHPLVVTPEIDQRSLMKYVANGYVPAPSTIVKNVYKLPAGHNAMFDLRNRSLRVNRYWRYEAQPDLTWLDRQEELCQTLVNEVNQAVNCRTQSDVPTGVFLSGGIDSSIVTSIAARTCARSNDILRTYSIGFRESSFDESRYFDRMAALVGAHHTKETLTNNRCIELIDTIYSRLDEPIADNSLVPTFFLCELAKNEITVALGGDGSDELFAGYDPFRALKPASLYAKFVPNNLHAIIARHMGTIPVSHRNMSFDLKISRFLSGFGWESQVRNQIWLSTLTPSHLAKLFGKDLTIEFIEELYEESILSWNATNGSNDVDRTIQYYIENYLQNNILAKIDRAGMLNSLEVRTPFLDISLIDLVRTIPPQLKFDGRNTKAILKKAFSPTLPPYIVRRGKKGFGVPAAKWFANKTLTINTKTFDGLMDVNFLEALYNQHLNRKGNWHAFLWAYLALERWSARPMFSQKT